MSVDANCWGFFVSFFTKQDYPIPNQISIAFNFTFSLSQSDTSFSNLFDLQDLHGQHLAYNCIFAKFNLNRHSLQDENLEILSRIFFEANKLNL